LDPNQREEASLYLSLKKNGGIKQVEVFIPAFNLAYLVVIWAMAIAMGWRYALQPAERRRFSRWLLASVLLLALGDSFHLGTRLQRSLTGVERMALFWAGREVPWTGVGAFATSLTLTFFYLFVLIYRQERYRLPWAWAEKAIVGLLAVRLLLLFFPQNNWGGPAPEWRIYRNVPFILAGMGVAALFLRTARMISGPANKWLRVIGWAVVVSFVSYAGTILLVERYPMAGILMLPKTVAYVVAVLYFYRLEFRAPSA